jgi:hypothetical protein
VIGKCPKCGAWPPVGLQICVRPDEAQPDDPELDLFFLACKSCEPLLVETFPYRPLRYGVHFQGPS